MTQEEVTFCNLVNAFVGSKEYTCLKLEPQGREHYWLKLHRLGDPEGKNKSFTVFANDLHASVKSGQLPRGLQRDLEEQCEV